MVNFTERNCMYMNNNDIKILELKNKIEDKRSNIKELKRFNPITNCILIFRGESYNLNVQDKQQLINLLVELNSLYLSYKNLDIEDEYLLNGFSLEDWISDIKQKIDIINIKAETKKLNDLETKLNKMLSQDKKTEMELNDIENMI